MRKKEWKPVFDRLEPFIEDAAQTHYDGNRRDGFKFWAVKQVLMDMALSDDAIKDPLELDGRSDLGLDGYYEAPDDEELILVQSRSHEKATPVGTEELNSFFKCLTKVLNPDVVVAAKNPMAQDAHRAVKDAIEKGWTLRFVFVTAGYLSSEGSTYATTTQRETEELDGVAVSKELEVYDLERLEELYESHLMPDKLNTDVEIQLDGSEYYEDTVGSFQVLVTSIPAHQIVAAFRKHKYALFKLNPRGPLQNRVNSKIKKTLEDSAKSKLFFHLNNGITALCDEFRVEDNCLIVRDFQIVNGCQTTVTLAKAGTIVEADSGIKVLLRLLEGVRGIRTEIAEATNTQARLKAQDFKSNDPLQQDWKNQFDALPTPIFYEVKRGDWEMDQVKRSRYQEKGTRSYRRIGMVDLAQATLAFLGEPGDAKDKSRTIFEDESRYKKVFPDRVRAQQLLLPWRIYEEAQKACRHWMQFPGATYARFCLVAIVGSEFLSESKLLSVQESAKLLGHMDRVQQIISRGQYSIGSMKAALGDKYPGHREFFRSADSFEQVLQAYKTQPK